jgi:glycosyltransferase involved in cell wall biosynthesis
MIAPLPAEMTSSQSLANRPEQDLGGIRIVVANWRDPWHPQAGGAERYAWEMARGLTARGGTVRYVTARAPGQARRDRRDGIEIVRLGGQFTVYPLVAAWLMAHRRSIDVVLDCQNGIPFFTPLVLPRRVPVLCVMHHVHTAQFGVHFPAWMAWVGRVLEGPAARLAYRRQACVAVSPSTVTAMRERLRWKGPVYLIPNGSPVPARSRESPAAATAPGAAAAGQAPHLVWVGRLVAHKRPELIVPVAQRGFTVEVIGRGPDAAALTAAVEAVPGLAGAVLQHGYLSEEDKHAVVAESLLHLNTSQGEGWGLCVLEAAALGVPTVAYDVEGLRDAVHDGQTGWLVKDGEELADVVERAAAELADPARREQVAAACRAWAGQLSWEQSTARMAALVGACAARRTSRGTRDGAWIVSHGEYGDTGEHRDTGEHGDSGQLVCEGPALDVLLEAGATPVRPATWAERLLGEVNRSKGPGGSAEPP